MQRVAVAEEDAGIEGGRCLCGRLQRQKEEETCSCMKLPQICFGFLSLSHFYYLKLKVIFNQVTVKYLTHIHAV